MMTSSLVLNLDCLKKLSVKVDRPIEINHIKGYKTILKDKS